MEMNELVVDKIVMQMVQIVWIICAYILFCFDDANDVNIISAHAFINL